MRLAAAQAQKLHQPRRRDPEERIAIPRSPKDSLGSNIASGTRSVLDNERLVESLREPAADQTRKDVCGAPGRKAHDQAHRTRRVRLRRSDLRRSRERSRARGKMEESSAGKFHRVLPLVETPTYPNSDVPESGRRFWPVTAATANGRSGIFVE
jgi:hypothetical protein